ncbi:TetR family transcriptional regulator [Hoeflea halophila]|uniref:TetR family transcriptional regulator n=1 Tax=Hoeflea halophila TaxID=714899 RepID=A0A286HLS8_9HYPH|nr:TetR/AcrR family transcriptional regulator [Hoeflea halophila]SOE08770.1 TetR family transcriptional regulator [Hoeflea halophila]
MSSISSGSASPRQPRRRAVSKRSLATSLSILNAAERLFAERGYEGASIRDIAKAAGAQVASVNFHHVSKETLFERVVERRASELSKLRLDALAELKQKQQPLTLEALLSAFLRPYLEKAGAGDPQWLAYARLVAMVSAEARWHKISERCFDPTAGVFIAEIAKLFPRVSGSAIAVSFIFSVASMLSLSTSSWRIEALAGGNQQAMDQLANQLIRFCEAGMRATLEA